MKYNGLSRGRTICGNVFFVLALVGLCVSPAHAQVINPLPDLELLTNGNIRAVALQPDGKIIVGGDFTKVGNVAQANLARLNPDGTLDTTWTTSTSGGVSALAIDGGSLYVGGNFYNVAGQNRSNLVRLSLATGAVDSSWNPAPDAAVQVIAVSGGDVYAGGWFNNIGGQPRGHIARLSGATGAANASWVNTVVNGGVNALVVSGDDLTFGGYFNSVGGQPRSNIARLSAASGSLNATFNPGANGGVLALATDATSLFVGGGFSTVGGINRGALAKLSAASGAVDPAWDPQPGCNVSSLLLSGPTLYAGGCFGSMAGQPRSKVAALDAATGAVNASWGDPSVAGSIGVAAMALGSGELVIAGRFTRVGGQGRFSLAKLSTSNGAVLAPTFADLLDRAAIFDLAMQADGKILVAGDLLRLGTTSVGGLIRLNSDGSWDAGFNPTVFGGMVNAVATSGTDIFIGGDFSGVAGLSSPWLAKLSTAGVVDMAWNANANGGVNTLALSGGSLYAGGWFNFIGGQNRNAIARLSTVSGAVDPAWNANSDSSVQTIVAVGSDLYVGGNFNFIGGQPRARLAKVSQSTALADSGWTDPAVSGFGIYAIAASGSDLFVGGSFSSVGGQSRNNLAKLSMANGVVDLAWNPSPAGQVNTLATAGDGWLYVGGLFNVIGGANTPPLSRVSTASGAADNNWLVPGGIYGLEALLLSPGQVYAGHRAGAYGSVTRNAIVSLTQSPPATGWLAEFNGNTTLTLFSPVSVGQSADLGLSLKNVGSQSTSLSNFSVSGPFTISQNNCSITLGLGSSCFMMVRFTPTTTGSASGALQVLHSGGNSPFTLNLSATGTSLAAPTLSAAFNPSSIVAGSGVSTLMLTFFNSNGSALTNLNENINLPNGVSIAAIANATTTCGGAWNGTPANATFASFSGGTIPANGSCAIAIDVKSASVGTFSFFPAPFTTAQVSGAVPAPTSLTVTAPATGWLSEFNGNTTVFLPGPIAVGSTAFGGLSLKNVGSQPLNFVSFSISGPFSIAQNNCSTSLPSNASCFVQIQFSPTAAGPASGILQVQHSGGNSPFSLNLSSTATTLAAPTLAASFSPNSIAAGGPQTTLTLTFNNPNATGLTNLSGNVSLPFGLKTAALPNPTTTCGGSWSGTLSNSSFVSFSGGGVPASGTCAITIGVVGSATGNFSYTPNQFATSQVWTAPSASTSLTVTAPPTGWITEFNGNTAITLFTPVSVGQYVDLGITLKNIGSQPASGASYSVSGPFTIVQNNCSATIGAGNACSMSVRFMPTTTGSASGTLQVLHSGGNSPFTLNLSGNGTSLAAPTLAAAFNPTSIVAGAGVSTLTLSFSNSNASALTNLNESVNLPFGLSIAAVPNATTTCGGAWNGAPANATFASFSGGTLAPNGSCAITIDVKSASVGTFSYFPVPFSTAQVYGAPVPASISLTVTAPPTGWLTESNGNTTAFLGGPIAVGSSVFGGVSLKNIGSQPLNLVGFSISGPFSISLNNCGASLASGASCFLQIQFSPTAAGPASGILQVQHSGGNSPFSLNLSASGTSLAAPTLAASFSPNSIAAGGAQTTLTLTFNNPNATALTNLSGNVSLPSGLKTASVPNPTTTCGGSWNGTLSNSSFASFSGGGVPASGTCAISINVIGTAPGNYSYTPLAFTTSQVWTAPPASTSITVTAPPTGWITEFNGNPGITLFSPVSVGQYADLGLSLRNIGSQPASVSSYSTSGPFTIAVNNCGTTIAAGASCFMSVRFTPTTTGSASGTLQVLHSGGNSPFTLNLSATGTSLAAPTLSAAFNPTSIVAASGVSTLTFTFSNSNGSALTNLNGSVNLPNGLSIAAVPNATTTCGGFWNGNPANATFASFTSGTIPANASCAIAIDVKANGNTGTYSFTPQGFSTSQVFTAPPNPPTLFLTVTSPLTFFPSIVDFGQPRLGSAPATQTVTVTNASGGPITFSAVSASSFNNTSAAFSIGGNSCVGTIANAATCTVAMSMSTGVTGFMRGNLAVSAGTFTLNVPLSGQVLGPVSVGPGQAPLALPNVTLDDAGGIGAIAKAPDGGYIVAGNLRKIQGAARANIGKVDANGNLVASFNPGTDGPVFGIGVAGSSALVAGEFNVIGGQARRFLAKISTIDGSVAAFNAAIPADAAIEAVTMDASGDVYVTGQFTTIGGATTTQKLVKLDGATGNLIAPWTPSLTADFTPLSLAANGGFLYVHGRVSCDPSGYNGRLLRIALTPGTVDPGWNPTPAAGNNNFSGFQFAFDSSGNVFTADASGASSSFSCPVVTPILAFQKLSATNGSAVPGFAVSATATPGAAIASNGTDLFAYGSLPAAVSPFGADCCVSAVTKLDGTTGGTVWQTPRLDGGALLSDGASLLVASAVEGLTSTSPGLISLSTATGLQNPGFTTEILKTGEGRRVAIGPDGKLYLGGQFTRINGAPRNHLARFNADGTLDTSWTAGVDGGVFGLGFSPTALYVTGYFTNSGGTARSGAAKFDLASGALDPSWNPNVKGGPRALLVNGSSVYLAGAFDSVGGSVTPGRWFAKVNDSTGALDTAFDPTAALNFSAAGLRALALPGNGTQILASGAGGGPFRLGTSNRSLARFDLATGAIDSSFDVSGGSMRALWAEPANNHLYVAGSFVSIKGVQRPRLARLNLSTGAVDVAFNPAGNLPDTIFTVVHGGEHVYLGGNQMQADGSTRAIIARVLASDGSYDASFTPSITSLVDGASAFGAALSPDGRKVYFATDTLTVAGQPREGLVGFLVGSLDPARPDWNADGKPDILWSNTVNGATYVWYMNGPVLISDAFIAAIDPSWKVQGVADFNGDGKPDLIWRNTANGNTYVWYMNGSTLVSDAFVFSLPPEWVIQGVADFNADGHPDFLMRNTITGVAFVWFFNNNVPIGDQFLFGIDPAWKVEQVGDLNGDGQPDLLFRNTTSGLAFAWYTQFAGGNLSLAGSSPPIFSIDPAWEIVQLADWNGDGKPDLLFRNRNSGVVFVWYMSGTTLGGSDFVIQIDPSWEIVPRH